jgi:hypothetical protein
MNGFIKNELHRVMSKLVIIAPMKAHENILVFSKVMRLVIPQRQKPML